MQINSKLILVQMTVIEIKLWVLTSHKGKSENLIKNWFNKQEFKQSINLWDFMTKLLMRRFMITIPIFMKNWEILSKKAQVWWVKVFSNESMYLKPQMGFWKCKASVLVVFLGLEIVFSIITCRQAWLLQAMKVSQVLIHSLIPYAMN